MGMNVLIGTAGGTGTGGVRSYIMTLRDALIGAGVGAELAFPDDVTAGMKAKAALKAMGDRDKARRELTRLISQNAVQKSRAMHKTSGFDLIHAQEVNYGSMVPDLGLPVVLTVHGPVSREAKMLGKGGTHYFDYLVERERIAYERATHIIAVDTGQRDIVVEDYGIDPAKITVILNAVDANRFAPKSQDEIPAPAEPFFLVPRRLVPKNGVLTAVEAFEKLGDIKEKLWIAGEGPDLPRLESYVAANGLQDRVKFIGSVDSDRMVELVNQSTGVIVPSVPVEGVVEASSISALEGMSVGKPVLASKIGGLAEIIEHGVTGLHFEAGDANALADVIRQASTDADLCRRIGQNARDAVLAEHSSEVWIKKVISVYERVL